MSPSWERFRAAGGPRIYAHRGASAHRLENTMAAFEQAIADGADGIELDVRASRDGEVVVFHDLTLARLAERPEVIGELTWGALSRVELKDGSRIPLLSEVLELVRGKGVLLNVELKGDGGRRFRLTNLVASLLRRVSVVDRQTILVSSFRPEMLVWLKALGLEVPRGFLFDGENTGAQRAHVLERAGRFDVVHPQFRLATAARVARWRAEEKLLNVWTVDAPDELRRLAGLGVDGLITNDPKATRSLLRESGHCGAPPQGL